METPKSGRAWTDVLQTLKDHGFLLYPTILPTTIDGEKKIFQDKVKLKQYLSISPAF